MKNFTFLLFAIVVVAGMLAIDGCSNVSVPEVQTIGASDVTSNSAKLSAVIVNAGDERILASGFYYSTDAGLANKLTSENNGNNASESFSVYLNNLQPNTNYYFAAYAINENGTGVGDIMSFTTANEIYGGSGGNGGGNGNGGTSSTSTVTLKDGDGQVSVTFNLGNVNTLSLELNLQVSVASGISSISLMETKYNSSNQIIGSNPVYIDNNYTGEQTYTCTVNRQLSSSDVDNAEKVVYNVSVVDNNNSQAQATYTVNVVRPLFTEGTFEWVKEGVSYSGFDEFGLSFYRVDPGNLAIVIKPMQDTRLYILNANDYAVTSLSAITFPIEAECYDNVLATSTASYDDVMATIFNGKTYLIHVTRATVTQSAAGTRVAITGTYKRFDYTPTPSSK